MVTRQAATTARKGDTIAASIAVAVGLIGFGLKGTGWILTGSEAIFSDALESTVNIVASIVALMQSIPTAMAKRNSQVPRLKAS